MNLRDRIAAANTAARKVADKGRADRQQRRDSFHADGERAKAGPVERLAAMTERSSQDYQPGETGPAYTPPPAAPTNKGQRKWPWIVGGIVLLLSSSVSRTAEMRASLRRSRRPHRRS